MRLTLPVTLGLLAAALAALVALGAPGGQQILHEGFEGPQLLWTQSGADAPFKEVEHKLATDTPHRGQRCEFLRLTVEAGNYVHYSFDPGRAPVSDDFSARVWVKANRPGTHLLARVVLPHEPNPKRLDEPLTTVLRGDTYTKAGRWQPLELAGAVKLLKEQQQLLRYEHKHDINITGAYVDRLLLNVYGGPGLTEVWIDDLEIGPVLAKAAPATTTGRETGPKTALTPAVPRGPALVELKRDHLLVRGERFFFRAIRHSDTPLSVLRDAGFNTVWFDSNTPAETVEEAARLRFLIVPSVPLASGEGESPALAAVVSRFRDQEQVLFWDLGPGGLAQEQAPAVNRLAGLVRAADPQRPLAADVWDGFQSYARHVGLLGVHRWPLMTALELPQYRDWLNQRRLLAQPGTFTWTWVQTHLPDWYTSLVYDRPAAGAPFQEPIGPQPEQVRLLTYTALSAGCRGLGFWSDRFLADSHHGRDRLLALALLNQEIQLLEPLLLTAEPPTWIDTSRPEVKAAVMRCERGVLVLPIWVGPGSQFVPAQGAVNNLSLVVPVPQYMEAWEVSPADVRKVAKSERVLGGTRLTLSEFDLTAAIVCTSDLGTLVYFQEQARKMRKIAAQWSHDLADAELAKVRKVHEQLTAMGRGLADDEALLARAVKSLKETERLWDENNFTEAYQEARRALRPLRVLMRAHWEEATREADLRPAVASPYAVSFYTLPRHWRLLAQVRESTLAGNVLPSGDFETPPGQSPPAWLHQAVTLDDVDLAAERVAEGPKEGRQCLKLTIRPKNAERPPAALERTFLAIHSPAVRLTPGSLVRVTGWLRVPKPIVASADGALLYDSAGGEPLAVRVTTPTEWKQFTLYRTVPASGTINVTLALTGLGTAYFDDVRIEPLRSASARGAAP